jgi:predicted amidohydrolase
LRVATVEFSGEMLEGIKNTAEYLHIIERYIAQAADNEVDMVVLPGFTGCFYQLMHLNESDLRKAVPKMEHVVFVDEIMRLSQKYRLLICPGSYWERHGQNVFHTACIIKTGQVILRQSQLYLARWEREIGLSRGADVEVVDLNGWTAGIILGTDVFYPRVARRTALLGADIVLSPVGFVGEKNTWLQASGAWQQAQLNHFFAVESAFNGKLGQKRLWGESIIHAPLPMTLQEDGILQRTNNKKQFIISVLDRQKRGEALGEFNALAQLNREFYGKIYGLGRGKSD